MRNEKARRNQAPGKSGGTHQRPRHEDALTIPLKAKKPRRWFVNSMSDLFHKEVPFEFIDKVFAVMALTPHHTYQILTKRPERMAEYMAHRYQRWEDKAWIDRAYQVADAIMAQAGDSKLVHELRYGINERWPLANCWLGTSVEDQGTADERIPHLLRCPAAVRFLSCEPLLGPVDLLDATGKPPYGDEEQFGAKDCIHWVIVGGESGPGARPMHPDWARSLRDQCVAAGVPYFFKQWGSLFPCEDKHRLAQSGHYCDVSHCWRGPGEGIAYKRIGKHKAGRVLDGRTWDEFPEDSRGQ